MKVKAKVAGSYGLHLSSFELSDVYAVEALRRKKERILFFCPCLKGN